MAAFCADRRCRDAADLLPDLPRPKTIKPSKRPYPHVRPDIDKLERAVLDGLTGVVFSLTMPRWSPSITGRSTRTDARQELVVTVYD